MPWAAANPADHVFRIFGGGFAALGLLFALIGVWIISAGRRTRRRGVETSGTIIGYASPRHAPDTAQLANVNAIASPAPPDGNPTPHMGMSTVECPVVRFRTATGQPIEATARNGSNPRPGRVGAAVTVFYDERDPATFWAQSGRTRAVSIAVGLACLLGGLLALIVGLAILNAA